MVRPDYCAVDHLQTGVAPAAVIEGFEEQLPQARQRPAPKLAVNRRPFAKMFVQIAPGNACPRDPENPIKNKAMILRATTTARAALDHEWRKTSPFIVTHQTPDHGSLLKSYLESDTTLFGNPLCQHFLGEVDYGMPQGRVANAARQHSHGDFAQRYEAVQGARALSDPR